MADGAPVPCVGQACLPLKVGNEVFLQYVLIADIEAPFVLGYDFLYQNNCLVDVRQGLLVFEDQTVQCVPESNMPSVFQIALQETIEIPAQSEMIAFGKFTGDRPHFSTAMIEPYDQSLSDNGILLAKTVIDTNCAAIPLRFVNFNSFPTKIYKNKIAFICHKGLYEFKVLPMGLINSPATYQRILETIMAGKQYERCLIYLDDLIVYSKTFDEHLQRLDEVFERISFANLKFSPKKCFLFSRETKFLGHRVSANGVSTCDDKVVAVKEWPIPTCVKDLRAFLDLASYYRRFIKSFSTIAAPLNKLTEKGVNFRWSSECQTAFDSLKSALVSAPILGYPNSHDTLYLDCDASSVGIGAVLSQVQNGQERVIAFFSKSLNKTQRQYCVTRRELLAIFEAAKHFHCYLYGVQFIVRTVHGALSWLMKFKNPSGQLARWLEVLSTYRFTIEHRAGVKHGNCDSLSRVNRPCSACIHCERREQEEREAQSNDVDNCRCNQSKSEKRETGSNSVIFNGQREKTPTNLTKMKVRMRCQSAMTVGLTIATIRVGIQWPRVQILMGARSQKMKMDMLIIFKDKNVTI